MTFSVDRITSKQDEFYTPAYAVEPLFKYITTGNVWMPFDTSRSQIVKSFLRRGFNVAESHIETGHDFFKTEPPAGTSHIISNPPYSLKGEVFERLFSLQIPFAMLVGVVGLFESKRRFEMFKNNPFEIMYLSKRVAYFKSYDDEKPSLAPPFSSAWVCSKVLPCQMVFEDIKK